MSYKGIDVSYYQGNIDWSKVKEEIDFAILRLGWIGNSNNHTLDSKFETYYKSCKSEGIPIGVYVYNYCSSQDSVKSGAEWVLNKLKGKSIDLPVYLDMEDSSIQNLGKDKLTNICIAFNTIIENAGYWAGVYANLNWYTNYLNKDIIKAKYTTWVAHYGVSQDRYENQYDMLQYSSTGKLSGISGNVDMDIMYRDLINDIKGSYTNKDTDIKTIEELANEVIAGNWGNGEERKKRLIDAGYSYSDVQNKVNEILREKESTNYYPACSSSYNSIVEALQSIGADSSFDNRKKIAVKNGISNYTGTATQNIQLLNKLKSGKLIKA